MGERRVGDWRGATGGPQAALWLLRASVSPQAVTLWPRMLEMACIPGTGGSPWVLSPGFRARQGERGAKLCPPLPEPCSDD